MMPFHGGIEASPNAAFILSLAAAAYYLFFVERQPSLQRSVIKTLAVILLAVLSVLRDGPLLLTAALAFSALGDAFLSRPGERTFLAGLASFLAAHALYISLFAASSGGLPVPDLWRVVLAIAMALGALGMMAVLWPLVSPRLRVPILVYAAAIFVMGLSALTMNSVMVVAGALLFMVSDGILASERFVVSAVSPHRRWMPWAVWITYYAAQLLITLGFLLPAM
jgi:uncharacterized membrane protein YhhN